MRAARLTVLVLGGHGQVGKALARASRDVVALGRDAVDVTDPRALGPLLARLRPRCVVNAAAFTAVDAAEHARSRAFAVNADGAWNVARAAAAHDLPLVHLSTDYVFGDAAGPHRPDDLAAPLGVYGASKLAGEHAVRAEAPRHVLLRTAWVFGRRRGFAATVLRRARAGLPLRIVDDQRGQPTPADGLAVAILAVSDRLEEDPWGTWHVAGRPATTWCGLARAAVGAAGLRVPIAAIPTGAWPARATRPRDSRLETSAFESRFGVVIDWRAALLAVVEATR